MKNKINEQAIYTRKLLIEKLDFLDGVVQEFVPTNNEECTGIVALDVKWKSSVHFIYYQTLWCGCYYVMRNNGEVSSTYHVRNMKDDLIINIQRLVNDINSGRYDNKLTPYEINLKLIREKGLSSYMNNTKWNKVVNIIRTIEEKTGKDIPIMYKCISDTENPIHYWSLRVDEIFRKDLYKYIEWFKIQPVVYNYENLGYLLEPKITKYDYTSMFLDMINDTNVYYEYLEEEEAYIIYGYR